MASPEKSNIHAGSFKDKNMQAVIGWILRGGVIVSMIIVFIGGVVYLYRHGELLPNYSVFKGVPGFVRTPEAIAASVLNFKGQAIIQAGIILLIATPVIRVLFSAIGFLMERDYLYTGITLLVLFIIFFSMLNGHVG